MPTSATSPNEMVVSTTFDQQSPPAKSKPRWWEGMTLDQQDEHLDRIDPEHCASGQPPPMSVGVWNREKRRVRRARDRWSQEILALRVPCHCKNCRENRRPPFPRYYVVNDISYECWLEMQTPDLEMEEFLAPLRNDRARAGTAVIGRDYGSAQLDHFPE